jgi:hypothetical protein
MCPKLIVPLQIHLALDVRPQPPGRSGTPRARYGDCPVLTGAAVVGAEGPCERTRSKEAAMAARDEQVPTN